MRRGETLWRIARSYGLNIQTLARANHLTGASGLRVDQRLFIPLPKETQQFLWPVRGKIHTSDAASGIEIGTASGTLIRASRSGRVAVATQRLSGWGKTVILDHWDGTYSVYARLGQILIVPGSSLRQGMPLGSAGDQALHFEIRRGAHAEPSMKLLPR